MKTLFSSDEAQKFRCDPGTLSIFCKQFCVLINAGVSLIDSLDALVDRSSSSPTLGNQVVPELRHWVENGHSLSTAFSKFPHVFPTTFVALIRGSEESGQLVAVLNKLSSWLEARNRVRLQVRKALTYPVFVIVLTGVLTLILFKSFVPQILNTVVGLGVDLPTPTLLLLLVVNLVDSFFFWLLVINLTGAFVWYLRTPAGYDRFLKFCRILPGLGPILEASDSAKYAQSLALLLGSGLNALKAVQLAGEASGNLLHRQDTPRLLRALYNGDSLSECYSHSPLYPRLMVYLLVVGDETGRTAHLMEKCTVMMEEDLRHRLEILIAVLEPVLLAFVSLLVCGTTVAVMLPMSRLLQAL